VTRIDVQDQGQRVREKSFRGAGGLSPIEEVERKKEERGRWR